MDIKQVIVMRKDLNMRKGKMIAQGAHAALKAVLENIDDPIVKEWYNGTQKKICVSVDSEKELLELHTQASKSDKFYLTNTTQKLEGDKLAMNTEYIPVKIPCSLILDSGLTEFGGVPTYTCCAIGPSNSDIIDIFTRELALL